jgi:N6-adenosine-specific RNA methylase IME4
VTLPKPMTSGAKSDGRFGKQDFVYIVDRDVYRCPTRGSPKRLNADVRQIVVEKRREHSRKPDGIHERIERLVAGPYLELFARQRRPGSPPNQLELSFRMAR